LLLVTEAVAAVPAFAFVCSVPLDWPVPASAAVVAPALPPWSPPLAFVWVVEPTPAALEPGPAESPVATLPPLACVEVTSAKVGL
jgi:hypothetical protein